MQGFDGAALDRWLTTDPREADAAAFEAYCDKYDVDPGADDAYERFEEQMEMDEESWAETQAEAARERMFDTGSDW